MTNRGSGTDAIAWWPSERGHTPEREPLTREQIVKAAMRVVDSEGLDALSMRRLGQELGAGATSLYWHVKNKDQLLDLIVDEVIGEVHLEDDSSLPWREQLARITRDLRAALVRHPGVAMIFGSRVTLGPNALAGIEHLLAILRSAGFEGVDLGLAYQSVLNYGGGFAVFESRPITGAGEGKSAEELQALIGNMLRSLPADRFPNLVALPDAVMGMMPDAQFEYGLQRMLDGMELDVARKRAENKSREGGDRSGPAA